jgi:hypothetical protein
MPTYKYKPVDPTKREIRLVRLLPGSFDDDIELEIFHSHLLVDGDPESIQYEALSYVWGSTVDPHSIHVEGIEENPNGGELLVTQNLAIALRYLRKLEPRTLWIDAICINQEDTNERGSEVSRMHEIYESACQVVVWLGPEAEDTLLALRLLQSIKHDLNISITKAKAMGIGGMRDQYITAELIHSSETARSLNDAKAFELVKAGWLALMNLCSREWFYRLWVWQEYKRSKVATALVGMLEFDLRDLGMVLLALIRHTRCNKFLTGLEADIHLTMARSITRWNDIGCFFDTPYYIDGTRRSSCHDPRDRVYAILGLLEPVYREEIIPDYTKPVMEVYKDFFLCHLRQHHLLDFMYRIEEQDDTLPSWIPNLGSTIDFINYGTWWINFNYGEAWGKARHEIEYSHADESLRTPGKRVGTVKQVYYRVPLDAEPARLRELCQDGEPVILKASPSVVGDSTFDDFIITLVCGNCDVKIEGAAELSELQVEYIKYVREGVVDETTRQIRVALEEALPGRAIVLTEDRTFGLCPLSAIPGDQIFILPGSDTPILLRPVEGAQNHFRIKGDCYVNALTCSTGLLGPLPNGWKAKKCIKQGYYTMVYSNSTYSTQNDPRLWPLPESHEAAWRDSDRVYYDDEMDEEGNLRLLYFDILETPDYIYSDPRLTPKALRVQGVELQDLVIV